MCIGMVPIRIQIGHLVVCTCHLCTHVPLLNSMQRRAHKPTRSITHRPPPPGRPQRAGPDHIGWAGGVLAASRLGFSPVSARATSELHACAASHGIMAVAMRASWPLPRTGGTFPQATCVAPNGGVVSWAAAAAAPFCWLRAQQMAMASAHGLACAQQQLLGGW